MRPSLLILFLVLTGCAQPRPTAHAPITHDPLRHITILSTNDIHGGVESSEDKEKKPIGGFEQWAATVDAIRLGMQLRHKDAQAVFLVDAGDQFQGTLISNYNEGQLVLGLMDHIGYDAAVPGNHAYDFGPIGFLQDEASAPSDRREALETALKHLRFPLISANTFYTDSIRDKRGRVVPVKSARCEAPKDRQIDWRQARRPGWLQPWRVVHRGGVRIAFIGTDNAFTEGMTTKYNVEDLCFADPAESYIEAYESLKSDADIFIWVAHDGNSDNARDISALTEQVLAHPSHPKLDAVISGHTHSTYLHWANGIPILQSGSGGTHYGRIDFVWDTEHSRLVSEKTQAVAGIPISHEKQLEGIALVPDAEVHQRILKARSDIAPLANLRLGEATAEIKVDRISENSLANHLTDTMRAMSGADVAIINGGGVRASVPRGQITYETLFRILPFSDPLAILSKMPLKTLVELFQRSIATCGEYGSLFPSGIRVRYQRLCQKIDGKLSAPDAHITRLETTEGKVLYDSEHRFVVSETTPLSVATVLFLAKGGSGYSAFASVPADYKGSMREIMKDYLVKRPVKWSPALDNRLVNEVPPSRN